MSYTESAACKLLASHCAACGAPLVDSGSIEAGMGPDCADKYGRDHQSSPEANKLVYRIALAASGKAPVDNIQWMIDRLTILGYAKLATRISKRVSQKASRPVITITVCLGDNPGGTVAVKTPYKRDPAFVAAWRAIPGRIYDRATETNLIPGTSKRQLWTLLQTWFAGAVAQGPKGTFTVR